MLRSRYSSSVGQQIIPVRNYPLFGKAQRFDGSRFFADNPQKLLGFLNEHAPPNTPLMSSSSMPPLHTSKSTSSLRYTVSVARSEAL